MKYLKKNYEIQELDAPNDICWLYGSFMDDYLHDVEICHALQEGVESAWQKLLLKEPK